MGVVVFDVLLVVIILAYTVYGWRSGFLFAMSSLVGLLIGALVAFFVVPLLGAIVTDEFFRVVVVLAAAIILVVAGQTGGAALGAVLEHKVRRRSTHIADRLGGAIVNAVATTVVLSVLASSLASFGIPVLSQTIARSFVLRAISAVEPDEVERFIAQVRSSIAAEGIPAIRDALGGISAPPAVPRVDTNTQALTRASGSVVRIIGSATRCNQSQSGTGFIIAPDRIITNAHVVAGVPDPTIEARNGQVLDGRVVYFDPDTDLAVVAVTGLDAPSLRLGDEAATGTEGVITGYPYGGPYDSSGAQVLGISDSSVQDIYGKNSSVRTVYTLAAHVREGDSGGPFLDLDGVVRGIIFARSANQDTLGYAMSTDELDPIITEARGLVRSVAPGHCVRK
jgi:S1-C subfamily serine protease